MNNKVIIPWSFSAIEAFELCPKKFYEEKITKKYKQSRSEVGDYGIDAHKSFEKYMLNDTALPMDLRHHTRVLDKIKTIPGTKLPEQKLAIDIQYRPTGFFDTDVYCRAVVDYAAINQEHKYMVIADWKFGKQKEGFDQIKFMVAVMSCYEPDIEKFEGIYYWARTKKATRITILKPEIPGIWSAILPRVRELEDAVLENNFIAIPNFLCKKYCPVTTCRHNGV